MNRLTKIQELNKDDPSFWPYEIRFDGSKPYDFDPSDRASWPRGKKPQGVVAIQNTVVLSDEKPFLARFSDPDFVKSYSENLQYWAENGPRTAEGLEEVNNG